MRLFLQPADRRGGQVDGQGGRGQRGGLVAKEGLPEGALQAGEAAGGRVRREGPEHSGEAGY